MRNRIPEHPGPGRLGRHIHHDPRSRNYPATLAGQLKSVSHRRYGPVLDQGDIGSCTANALVQALMCAPLHRKGRTLTEDTAVALYSRATKLDPFPGSWPPDDTGSDGLSVCKAAVEAGLIAAYHHAFGLDQALHALVLSPVIAGIAWKTGCDTPNSDGIIRWTGTVRGGHELCFHRLDLRRQLVGGTQSWGPLWGLAGEFWMPIDDFGAALAAHGDVTVPAAA